MKKTRILYGLLVIIIICSVACSPYLYQKRKQTSIVETGQKDLNALNPVVEYNGIKYRRNSYIKAILFIGVDSSGEMAEEKEPGSAGQADGLFLAAEDHVRGTIEILLIPRDTMAEITLTDIAGNVLGKDVQHITLAYAYGDGREKSCCYLREAVSNLLGGLTIDHYMAVNTSAIAVLNNGVDGVPVLIDTDELMKQDSALKKGANVILNGKQAELFLRYRNVTVTNSALIRMERQKQYIKAYLNRLQEKCRQDENLIVRLTEDLQEYILTDMDKSQYYGMAKSMINNPQFLAAEDIYTVPGQGTATELYDEFHPDKEALRKLILELFYREVK